MRESDLKSQVSQYLQYLENQGRLCFLRLNAGRFVFEDKYGKRRVYMGARPGCADYLILTNNSRYDAPNKLECIPIFIELKATKGKQTSEQQLFQHLVERQGAEYSMVRSLEDLQGILNDL